MKLLAVQHFFARFPDDAACLEHLMIIRYGKAIECPKCWKKGNFTKLPKLLAYSCPWCGITFSPHRIWCA
jgi:transposase